MRQGARKYIFIGRSGTENPAAKSLVQDLELAGANVKVIKGDIYNADVTASAVKAADTSIGGVIQAAMSLKVQLQRTESTSPNLAYHNSGFTILPNVGDGLACWSGTQSARNVEPTPQPTRLR